MIMALTAEAKKQRKLTKELWKKDPAWFTRAAAYRLLWVLLHPSLSRLLPRGLFAKVFAAGSPWDPATFTGLFGFPAAFPPGYYPPGGEIPTPDGTMPEAMPPGWPGAGGAIPPITNPPWIPGPPHAYSSGGAAVTDIGELLRQQWPGDQGFDIGNNSLQVRLANIAGVDVSGNVAAVKMKVGKAGAPLDNVSLAFYSKGGDDKPDTVITGGTSATISGAVFPLFDVDQDFIIFYFPSRPLLEWGTDYYLAVQRSGSIDAGDYYIAFGFGFRWGSSFYQDAMDAWGDSLAQHFDYEIWGFPV